MAETFPRAGFHINNELLPRPEQEVIHHHHCVDPAGHTHWALRDWGGLGQVPNLAPVLGRLGVTSQPSVNWPDFKSLGVYQKQCGERLTAPMRAEASAIA